MKRGEVQFTAKNTAQLVFIEEEIKEDSIVVKNDYSLISPGTELALFCMTHIGFTSDEIEWAKYPIAAGYASVGKVINSPNMPDLNKGDIIMHYKPHGDYSHLSSKDDLYFKLSDKDNEIKSLFTRFGQISYTAVASSQKENGHVLVYGGGLIGNICAQLFKLVTNREVTVADISNQRLELARKCGLNTLNPKDKQFKDKVDEITNSMGFDTIVEATGVPSVINAALNLVNLRGEVILLGSTRGLVTINPYKDIHRKFINIIGAHENRFEKFGSFNTQEYFGNEVLKYIEKGLLQVGLFVTDHIQVDNIEKAYYSLLEDSDKHLAIIIDWDE